MKKLCMIAVSAASLGGCAAPYPSTQADIDTVSVSVPRSSLMVAALATGGTAHLVPVSFDDLKDLVQYDADVSLSVVDCMIDSAFFEGVTLFVIDGASLNGIPDTYRLRLRYPDYVPVFLFSESTKTLSITSEKLEEILLYQLRGEMKKIRFDIRNRKHWYNDIDVRVVYVK